MEILRRQAKSGKTYRIYDNNPAWGIYQIEWLKIYRNEDGDVHCWNPAILPIKLYTDLNQAKMDLEDILKMN